MLPPNAGIMYMLSEATTGGPCRVWHRHQKGRVGSEGHENGGMICCDRSGGAMVYERVAPRTERREREAPPAEGEGHSHGTENVKTSRADGEIIREKQGGSSKAGRSPQAAVGVVAQAGGQKQHNGVAAILVAAGQKQRCTVVRLLGEMEGRARHSGEQECDWLKRV